LRKNSSHGGSSSFRNSGISPGLSLDYDADHLFFDANKVLKDDYRFHQSSPRMDRNSSKVSRSDAYLNNEITFFYNEREEEAEAQQLRGTIQPLPDQAQEDLLVNNIKMLVSNEPKSRAQRRLTKVPHLSKEQI